MMKKLLVLLFILFPTFAFAQTPMVTKPYGVSNVDNKSGTIAVTNTFQQIFPASTVSTGRVSCAIQNTGTNAMYIFFGEASNATVAKSVKLLAGQSCNYDSNGTVIRTAVQITGTATETYYASQQ